MEATSVSSNTHWKDCLWPQFIGLSQHVAGETGQGRIVWTDQIF